MFVDTCEVVDGNEFETSIPGTTCVKISDLDSINRDDILLIFVLLAIRYKNKKYVKFIEISSFCNC